MNVYINTVGKFTFKDPVNLAINEKMEYKVVAIRSIKELVDTGDDPFNTIYVPLGITEDKFREDVKNNINIIVLTNTSGNTYSYIPSSYISTAPDSSGYKYADTLLAVNLGKIPLDLDLTNLKEEIRDLILAKTGLTTEVKHINTSAIELVDEVTHLTFLRKINYGGSKEQSYRIKYEKLLEAYNHKFGYTGKINDGLAVKLENEEILVN